MNKKILIALNTLDCGGIEKSALVLIQCLVERNYEITLLLSEKKGDFIPFIPNSVKTITIDYPPNVKLERYYGRKKMILYFLKHLYIRQGILMLWHYIAESFLTYSKRNFRRISRDLKNVKPITEYYDLALAYANLEQLYFVSDYVLAKKKAVWFHIENPTGGIAGYRDWLPCFKKMDALYCVSRNLEEQIVSTLYELKDRIFFYPHIFNTTMMYEWAKKDSCNWPGGKDSVKLLSVGRVRMQKGFDIVPKIVSLLKKDGFRVTWCILGDGSLRPAVEAQIRNQGVEDSVFLLGTKVNPYPYFDQCDIYVQPSRDEGYCLTVGEARAFHKPIVATDFFGAREQLEDGKAGMIVKFGVEEIYKGIKRLLENNRLCIDYKRRLEKQKIDSTKGVELIEALLMQS